MITEVIRYKIPAADAAAFVEAYRAAGRILSASPHCRGVELLHGSDEPENWVLLVRWVSAASHLEGFRGSPEFGEFLRLVIPYYGAIEEMKHYVSTDVVWAG